MDAPPPRGTIVKTTLRPRGRDHRVDAVERRHRRAEADHAERRPDPVPGDGARRDVARERRRFHSRARRGRRRSARAASARFSAVMLDKILAGKAVAVTPFIDEIERGDGAAGARRRISKRCSSSCTCDSRSRAPIRPRSPRWRRRPEALLANQMASPDVVFNQAIDAALSRNSPRRPARDAGHGRQVEPRRSRWRSTRRASRTRATSRSSSSAASRPRASSRSSRPTSPACRRRTRNETWRDLGITPPAAWSRRPSRRASRRRARWRSSSPGRSSTTTRTGWRCGR